MYHHTFVFFMCNDLSFINTTKKFWNPPKNKKLNSQDGWEKTSYQGISREGYRQKHEMQVASKKVYWKNNRVLQTLVTLPPNPTKLPPHQNKNPQQRLIPPTTKLEGGTCPDYPNNRHTTSQSHFSVPQVNAQVYLSTCSTGLLWSKFHNVFRTFNMELDPNCFERHWTFCWI